MAAPTTATTTCSLRSTTANVSLFESDDVNEMAHPSSCPSPNADFTFWDRLFGSFHYPEHYAGTGVHDTIREIEVSVWHTPNRSEISFLIAAALPPSPQRKEAAAAGKSNGASSPSSAATTSTSQMVTRSAKKRAPAAGRD